MPTFTLDTNCIIAVERGEPNCEFVRRLADAHAAGTASVAVGAISASERQRGGPYANFAQFRERLAAVRLDHLELLRPMLYFDVTYFDWSLFSDDAMQALERAIHNVLFPGSEFAWADYARRNALDLNAGVASEWRNRKCDVQAIWCHIYYQRNVFVTADANFHAETKKRALIELGAGDIVVPGDAIRLLA